MLIIFNTIRRIEKNMAKLKHEGKIADYRLILKLNMSVSLFIVTNRLTSSAVDSVTEKEDIEIDIEKISEEEFNSDEYYSSLFKNTKPLDMGLRRSLSNMMEHEHDDEDDKISSCPIISFYSYKGGVGRTTALALFASYCSIHHAKKVFIIDCDFEAPGLINFFGFSNEEPSKNGIVEYIKDKEAFPDMTLSNDYVFEVSRNYSKDGQIYILPAGNIINDPDRDDYLEALARLDIHSTDTIVRQFRDLITGINKEYNPDLILIDSKTGFNDIFGIIVNRLSDIIVGFFGNNMQNKPGLYFFLDTLLGKKRDVDLILVNAILSSSIMKRQKSFQKDVDDYIQNNLEESVLDSLPVVPVFGLSRYPVLEDIGTQDEDPDDFISSVEQGRFGDYHALFQKLAQKISEHEISHDRHADKDQKKDQKNAREHVPNRLRLKRNILDKIYDNFPEPYAENIEFNDHFLNTEFYFRKCMEDIFNHDKFLLLGSKGAGKTAFYKALRQKKFFDKLMTRAQKKNNYQVIDIISLLEDPGEKRIRFFDIANFDQNKIQDPDYFYRRFWIVYIWDAIMLSSQETGFSSGLEVREILNDSSTADFFNKYISEEDLFGKLEKELHAFDDFLNKNDRYVMIIFDQIDRVAKPRLWPRAVSPLIRYFQSHHFRRILPRLFVRRDLFSKLKLTNIKSLEKQAIDLEWSNHELYAFFFKLVFAHSEKDFYDYIQSVKSLSEVKIKETEQKLRKANSYNQLQPEEHLLRPLVETFFGIYADHRGTSRYGEMYEWIFRNLKNADNTISLRPFLDLIKYAIEEMKKRSDSEEDEPSILSAKRFNREVRIKAVKRHFEDIAAEEGNEILRIIIDDIRNNKVPEELKISSLYQNKFEKLLNAIIRQHEELKNVTIDELEDILVLNGIIFVSYPRGDKMYSFAYLYKYFLGLRSPKRRQGFSKASK